MKNLKEKFANISSEYIKEIKSIIKPYMDKVIDQVTLGQVYGGMRGVMSLVTETSALDPLKGISFHGYNIEDLYAKMPKTSINSHEPLPEALFILFLLGRIPEENEIKELSLELKKRATVPEYVYKIIDSFPKNSHPMIKFTTAVSAMQNESLFTKAYHKGIHKNEYWEYVYEDVLNIIAMLPRIVSYIYNHNYNEGNHIDSSHNLDFSGNLAEMLGDKDSSSTSKLKEFMRLYLSIHSDHEGGNASAFTCHVVASTLANSYSAYSGAMQSLSGPLHGLACQTVLDWINNMIKYYNTPNNLTKGQITDYIHKCLANGQVIPGYGHAVLRKTDPRFTAQMKFAKNNNMTSQILEAVWSTYEVAPDILNATGKVKNPYPNVDAHSGAILNYLGLENSEFYTVLFGTSRALGILSSQIWDRAFGYPIHRPKSITSEWVKENITK